MRPTLLRCTTSALPYSFELQFQGIELVIVELFELNQLLPCAGCASEELIELELQGSRIAVLGVLQQERDEKRHLRRRRVHRQLPCIRELKNRP